MFTLVVGGAASGKSEYAEQLILRAGALPRYYVATMEPFGAEARARIARHRVLRAQKRFETIECPVGLSGWGVISMSWKKNYYTGFLTGARP